MRIAVDAQSMQGQRTGIGVYAENLIGAMRKASPGTEFVLYGTKGPADLNTPGRIFWESLRIPGKLFQDKPDLVFSPGFAPSFWAPVPRVATVHDLIGMIFPRNLGLLARFYWSTWLPLCAKRAETLVASSESTRRDMARFLGIDPVKVEVVPMAGSGAFHPVGAEAVRAARDIRGFDKPYFLTVGTLEPRKNLASLVLAFKMFEDRNPGQAQLVIAGKDGGEEGSLRRLIAETRLEKSVVLLGYAPDVELNALLNGAMGYAFLSKYEGFGLPVLEAMSCGLSGVCSNVSSLPEVAGDTALYADPENADDIAGQLERFFRDASLRRGLASKASARASEFSWEKAARRMLAIFERTAKGTK